MKKLCYLTPTFYVVDLDEDILVYSKNLNGEDEDGNKMPGTDEDYTGQDDQE